MASIITEAFQLASDFVNYTDTSIFLTGKAGTGKTTFLKYCKENKVKNTAIVAPTGVAAINAGGTTIHSFFQLPFLPFVPLNKGFGSNEYLTDKSNLISRLKLNAERKEVMQRLELLIIDEVSMVRCDVLDAIDTVLRHVRSQYSRAFGGVQVLLIGDMYQLPPVIKDEEWQILSPYYKSQYFFSSHVIEGRKPVYVELDRIFRQSDASFISILNKVRNNEMDEDGYKLLHSRYQPDLTPAKEENYITLTTHNHKAEAINFKALNELAGTIHNFNASIEGEFYEKSYPADLQLKLKAGAQVMFLKNDTEKVRRYFNGKIGIVEKIEDEKILIKCTDDASLLEVRKEKWKNIRYVLDKNTNQVEEQEFGSFTQFPLRLAWAITIHKSQGLTFEKAIIDAGESFAPGQVYVALSRCTSLNGLILHSRINNNSLHTDHRIAVFTKIQNTSGDQLKILQRAKHQFQQTEITAMFDFAKLLLDGKAVVSFINLQHASFSAESVGFLANIDNLLKKEEATALKFLPQLKLLLDQPLLPEQNEPLQKRIIAACNHFCGALENIKNNIDTCPVVTDSKVLSTEFNALLLNFYNNLCLRLHLFTGCKQGFCIDSYLRHKRTFTRPALSVNAYAGKTSIITTDSPHPQLYKLLHKKRDAICQEKNIPVYLVANRHTLEELAAYLPQNYEELSAISGFGPTRSKQYGEAFLEIINTYCGENNLQTNILARPGKKVQKEKKPVLKPGTKMLSFLLYKEGKTIAEIAKERNLAIGTIEGHLTYFITTGEIQIDSIVSPGKQAIVKTAVEKHGIESHKTLVENMGREISYGELKMILAGIKYETL